MFLSFVTNLLEPLSYLIFSIALFVQLNIFKKTRIRVLFIYNLIATVSLSYASWLAHRSMNNNYIYNLLYLPAVIAFCFYFYRAFKSKKNKRIVLGVLVFNIVYFLARLFLSGPLALLDSVAYSLLSISVCFLSFLFFYAILSGISENKIWHQFDFWLVSALLLYFLGSFFIFLMYSNLTYNILSTYTNEQRKSLTILWGVHNVLLFLSSLTTLFSSLWISYRNR